MNTRIWNGRKPEPNELRLEFLFAKDYSRVLGASQTAKPNLETPVKMSVKTPVKTPEGILAIPGQQPDLTLLEVAALLEEFL